MPAIIARGCPPGPYPGWCDPGAPSWWTAPHLIAAAALAVALGCAVGLGFAYLRDSIAARRLGR